MTNPTFDSSAANARRQAYWDSLNKAVLAEPVNTDYPDGVKEIAELLTYLPEDRRMAAVNGFVGAMLYV